MAMVRTFVSTMVCLGLSLALFSAAPAANAADPAVQQLIDRAQIENLLAAAVFAVDRRDPEAFRNYFTSDGEVQTVPSKLHPEGGATYKGEKLKDFITKNQRLNAEAAMAGGGGNAGDATPANIRATGNGVSHHIVSSNHIEFIDATHARHLGYWSLNGRINGVYSDLLVKADGKWLFQVRKIHYDSLNPDAK